MSESTTGSRAEKLDKIELRETFSRLVTIKVCVSTGRFENIQAEKEILCCHGCGQIPLDIRAKCSNVEANSGRSKSGSKDISLQQLEQTENNLWRCYGGRKPGRAQGTGHAKGFRFYWRGEMDILQLCNCSKLRQQSTKVENLP
ncbi:hypothetical protein PoB_001373500 [Plakobranchus ocellatus]|uniref:Uncharacterized protein n=1 Tax=Plakobranchus ocellatus TaxID=259542 RepID=A0AAV3YVI5_9GAST|nr:hypothetical protein PoB_001373500 [Plakobranchus ocellatus]